MTQQATRSLQIFSLIFTLAIGVAVAIVGIYAYQVNDRANRVVRQNQELAYQGEVEAVSDCKEEVRLLRRDGREEALIDIALHSRTDPARAAEARERLETIPKVEDEIPIGTEDGECPELPPPPEDR